MRKEIKAPVFVLFLALVFCTLSVPDLYGQTTKEPELSDLTIIKFTMNPENPVAGQQVEFRAILTNIGHAPSRPCKAELKFHGDRQMFMLNVPVIHINERYSVKQKVIFPKPGNYTARIIADATTLVRESNETNNTMDLDFTVAVPPKPDLVIKSFTNTPVSPTVLDSINFKVLIKNIGAGAADESLVKIKVGGEGTSPTYRVPGLAAGATFTVSRVETIPVVQNYLARATVDSDSTVAETDETNNEKELYFSVLPAPKPDLTILSFTIDPVSPNTSDAIKFTAVVKNIGPGDSDITKLKIKVGGEGTSPTYTIPILRTGETFTMMRTVTLPVAQNYLAQAIADCDNIIEENNEGNNSSSYSFTVTNR
ncbi:MAG: hypothetical protein JW737_06745 [Acidobacteria bacterium]|nr:hypothetical protein [Acidobacteriota bacterium]